MGTYQVNTKNIAKNTLVLYLRMILSTVVSLYTSRVILEYLGITDYGIYNVAGGIVSILGVFSTSLSSSTQRFLNICIGESDDKKLFQMFNKSITLHLILGILILLVGETVGLWLINNKLVIPEDRIFAAKVVYQISLITTVISILRTPFLAAIIAFEKMTFFAYSTIAEVFMKLIICYLIVITPYDRLIVYTILLLVVSFVITVVMAVFCRKILKLDFYKYYKIINGGYGTLISFSGWTMVGTIFSSSSTQVINLIFNNFFGVVINAAMGITTQISGVLSTLIINFQTAYKPPIVKSFASGDKTSFSILIKRTTKCSFFLVFVIACPFFFSCDVVLGLWLKEVPPLTSIFVQVAIIHTLIDSLSRPFFIAIEANGRIKGYHLLISLSIIVSLILSILCVVIYKNPPLTMLAYTLASGVLMFIIRLLYFLKFLPEFKENIFEIISPIIFVILTNIPIYIYVSHITTGLNTLIGMVGLSMTITLGTIYLMGLNKQERYAIKNILYQKINRK